MRPLALVSTLCALFFVFVFGGATPALAKPAVTWNPEAVEETVSRGDDAVTITVTVTVEKRVGVLDVVIVPEIDFLVDVAPATVGPLARGGSTDIELSIRAPEDTPYGRYDGTVHLVDDSKTVSQPLPVVVVVGQEIGTDGGVLMSNDGIVELSVPSGALSESEVISVEADTVAIITTPEWGEIVGPDTYDFSPSGLVFEKPATLTAHYNPDDVPFGFAAEDLVVGYENHVFEVVGLDGCSADTTAQTVTCPVWHFTRFLIVAPSDTTPPAEPTEISIDFVDITEKDEAELDWTNPTDTDFSHVKIYRSSTFGVLGTTIATGIKPLCGINDVDCTEGPPYVTPLALGLNCFVVRAVDFAGNESQNAGQFCAFR